MSLPQVRAIIPPRDPGPGSPPWPQGPPDHAHDQDGDVAVQGVVPAEIHRAHQDDRHIKAGQDPEPPADTRQKPGVRRHHGQRDAGHRRGTGPDAGPLRHEVKVRKIRDRPDFWPGRTAMDSRHEPRAAVVAVDPLVEDRSDRGRRPGEVRPGQREGQQDGPEVSPAQGLVVQQAGKKRNSDQQEEPDQATVAISHTGMRPLQSIRTWAIMGFTVEA